MFIIKVSTIFMIKHQYLTPNTKDRSLQSILGIQSLVSAQAMGKLRNFINPIDSRDRGNRSGGFCSAIEIFELVSE